MNSLIKFFAKIVAFIFSLLPRSWVRTAGSFFGFLWYDVFGIRKKVIMGNLEIAFPDWSEEKKLHIARESVYNMGYGFFEVFTLPYLKNPEWYEKNVVFEGEENYKKALEQKKGVLVLSLHLGTGDMGASAISMKGYPLTIITKVFKNKIVNDLWFAFRGGQGVKFIDAHGDTNAFDILKTLKRNEGVIFVLDQFMGKPYGLATNFFGRRTGTAYGLALFAMKAKSPIIPVYTYEGEDQKMHVVFDKEIPIQDLITEDKDRSMVAITQRFNDKIEEIIKEHPEHWMWVHRRWKNFD